MFLQRPPIYGSKESSDMQNWFQRLYTILKEFMTLGTTVATTSGTSHDFTGIPAGTWRITINFSGVSTNGTSNKLIQLGDAGGIETTVYSAASSHSAGAAAYTTGFGINSASAPDVLHGSVVLTLLNSTTNLWCAQGNVAASNGPQVFSIAGSKALSGELTQIRITTVNGTDTFDAGSVNILIEKDL